MPEDLRTALVEAWFEGSSPSPCQSPEQLALLRRIEEKFPPLEASAKVGIGVATGNDSVFVTKDAGLVEKSRLLKLALAGDALHDRFAWSGHYLVDPWDRDARSQNKDKQLEGGRIDAGTRGEVTSGTQMGALEVLISDILCNAGLEKLDIRTRTA